MGDRQMHLNFFRAAKCGHVGSAWRHPFADPAHAEDLDVIVRMSQLAERACFDSIFLADAECLLPEFIWGWLPDPMVVLGAIAASTERIGLMATLSTTFHEPYDVARKFATLDLMSGGRAGWNIVTSTTDASARNYGKSELLDTAERYARADEFVEVTKQLWDSWEDGALVLDQESGIYADADKVRAIDHEGRYFRVAGPLNAPRMPQRYPVLVQAGQSEAGRDFAARHAEVIFTAQTDRDDALRFTEDIRSRAAGYGRSSDAIKILPGLIPIVGGTDEEAHRLESDFKQLIDREHGLAAIRFNTGLDLSEYDLDGPVPTLAELPSSFRGKAQSGVGKMEIVLEWAEREQASIRDLMWMASEAGHLVLVGSPETIADRMEEWFAAGACDGFNVAPPILPKGLEDFADGVIPLLQQRGLFRTEYTGSTLRDHLGLSLSGPTLPAASPVSAA
jgi:FMN-dependent oxidoreductase (nitrilotriacetate monooxygenase family)